MFMDVMDLLLTLNKYLSCILVSLMLTLSRLLLLGKYSSKKQHIRKIYEKSYAVILHKVDGTAITLRDFICLLIDIQKSIKLPVFDSFADDCGATIVGIIISAESVPEENGFKVDCWKGLEFDWLE